MYFHNPVNSVKKEGAYTLKKRESVVANGVFSEKIYLELFGNACCQTTELTFSYTDEKIFAFGTYETPDLNGNAYALSVTEKGVCVAAKDEESLRLGFFALLERIACRGQGKYFIPASEESFTPSVSFRSVHFCLFPETRPHFFKRFVRTAAVLGFTHIVLEFWGTVRLNCLPELGWKEKAYTMDEIKAVVAEANALGVEIIPMFNHWGHATLSRVSQGKHVVLDQAPEKAYLFDETGWNWAIDKEEVRALQRTIRKEICALCGEGKYFHIGCDEAYGNPFTQEEITAYLNGVADELILEGRTPIMWGDMLVSKRGFENRTGNIYTASATKEEQEYFLTHLSKNILIADWQYDAKKYPIETALVFQEYGYDTVLCPWDCHQETLEATKQTVQKHGLFGVMHTTWHTLSSGYTAMVEMAYTMLGTSERCASWPRASTSLAALMRKLLPATSYEDAGWSAIQTPDRT